jgi:hypothetical protein
VLPHPKIRSQAGTKEKRKENKGNERKREKMEKETKDKKKSRKDGRLPIQMHYLCWCNARMLKF